MCVVSVRKELDPPGARYAIVVHHLWNKKRKKQFLETNRIEGVNDVSTNDPLTRQDAREEEKQMLHVRFPFLDKDQPCRGSASTYLWAMTAL